ncbi:hypothetical protein [Bradyrhizobium sp. 6(2017)]|uniref:hypothetical protein n=1 Tax=Bradyrhizobium sp. 6(2017) TaxID=1197460 RepID=UPI0013E186AE|nr:hypothetical protein [Bradyrhizobium sp. 6(2017)]QIG97342.1 hypothetical protein G6P99_36465 [Bradyrhizobium sp. 6(2017)]
MKSIFSTTAVLILLAAPALAEEAPVQLPKVRTNEAAKEAEDCSKQVWPHFTQACLRAEGKGIAAVRLVTTERR